MAVAVMNLLLYACVLLVRVVADLVLAKSIVFDNDLMLITEKLLSLDVNNAGQLVQVNIQQVGSCSTGDQAHEHLFISVNNSIWERETFAALLLLLDNYEPDVGQIEDHDDSELFEENKFLTAIMKTVLMQEAYRFLKVKGLFQGSNAAFKAKLKELWFSAYDRDGNSARTVLGSSGFEHVFVGELKHSKVGGLHNWVSFYKKEATTSLPPNNAVNYLGYSELTSFNQYGSGLTHAFTWKGAKKCRGSMLVGTSPEYELAIYTICFIARRRKPCRIMLNNVSLAIKTYPLHYKGKTYIGTAYPLVPPKN